MLRAIDTDIWVAEQPLKYFGLEVGTRMTVIRLNDDKLMVISPIRIDEALIHQLNQLGDVGYIVVPNLYHHLFVAQFKEIYPDAELWATPGLEQKRPDLVIDQILSDRTSQLFDGVEAAMVTGFNTLHVKGYSPLNEWVFFHVKSRSLIVTDLAFHFDRNSSLTAQLVAKLLGGYQQLRPSLLEKIATQEKDGVKKSIQQILTWDFERVIMAHGSILEQDGRRQFQIGYEWFLGTSL
ncbi:DUF4336 domain-containing protein [Coleofasciculus sp. FACHB-1120]|uniref:DUF4336 domain-containing protein n=1 Tax=Coleofasciculus sp. FACHB-1120 TaxID=2692783 RepID=UPI0016829213|nr:DUF4336 domain-containing protein [Coleofasciculus sp. FACHB-1120]MBD2742361.1 DUF4336 domain-containing protein [Coleofasciculus sp. FACHB-1120]